MKNVAPPPLQRTPFGPALTIDRYRLDNGLTLLCVVDPSAPVICYQTWFSVGSRLEREGKTGIAHLFEHLMFNETEGLPYGEFDRRLEAAGAESNAATFLDWTYYHENLPREALPLVIELEAERMQHLVLREPQVESEREVVANERRQTVDDDVDGAITELLYQEAFTVHGYRWPTIGYMADIERLSLEDCRRFYGTYYAPNNATLVVVGDVDVAHLLTLVEARYGAIAPAEIPAEPPSVEPDQQQERRVVTTKPTETSKLALGYKSPAMGDADHAPLVLLNEILFGGRGSRVHRALVQQREIASEAGGYVGNFRDPSLWDIYLTAHADYTPSDMLTALDEVLDGVFNEPPSQDELERARARIELATLQGLETVGGKAEHIGFGELVLNDPGALWSRLETYASTTGEDLRRVARRYLRRTARTVVEAHPEPHAPNEET
jgi:zinc protease